MSADESGDPISFKSDRFNWTVDRMHEEPGGAVAELLRQREELLARVADLEHALDAAVAVADPAKVTRIFEAVKPLLEKYRRPKLT